MPDDAPVDQELPAGMDRRTLLLLFTDDDPRLCHDAWSGLPAAVAASGMGQVELVAPFVPTVPGTDRYCDELW
jgi:hypothetical protein